MRWSLALWIAGVCFSLLSKGTLKGWGASDSTFFCSLFARGLLYKYLWGKLCLGNYQISSWIMASITLETSPWPIFQKTPKLASPDMSCYSETCHLLYLGVVVIDAWQRSSWCLTKAVLLCCLRRVRAVYSFCVPCCWRGCRFLSFPSWESTLWHDIPASGAKSPLWWNWFAWKFSMQLWCPQLLLTLTYWVQCYRGRETET